MYSFKGAVIPSNALIKFYLVAKEHVKGLSLIFPFYFYFFKLSLTLSSINPAIPI